MGGMEVEGLVGMATVKKHAQLLRMRFVLNEKSAGRRVQGLLDAIKVEQVLGHVP